jgi:serine/threonine-protein kinase
MMTSASPSPSASDQPAQPSQLSISACHDILRACERLEEAWRAGHRPLPDAFLDAIPPDRQPLVRATLEDLLAELKGDPPRPDRSPPPASPEASTAQSAAKTQPTSPQPELATVGSARTRFSVVKRIARGGMGQVSEAFDHELDRPVALKEILPSGANNPAYQARFQTEAEITAHLEHPGIIPIYSRGQLPDGRLFYTMRLIGGDQATLQKALKAFHTAPPADPSDRDLAWRGLLRRVIDVCHTMAYAHGQGVLHRDLKPSNILLGPNGETLVVDWGLARRMHRPPAAEEPTAVLTKTAADLSQPTAGVGTVGYMAPEQSAGRADAANPASDIYSLGSILRAVVTGATPTPAAPAGFSAVLEQVGRAAEPERPSMRQPGLDPALEAICLKAMARDPVRRYSTATAMAEDLERFLAGEPVTAWSEPWSRRAARWLERRRTLVVATTLGMLLVIAGLTALSFVQSRNRNALAEQAVRLDEALTQSRAAQTLAEQQQTRAETEEATALQAVRRFHRVVADNLELRNTGKLAPLRKQLLEESLAYHQQQRARLLAMPDPSFENLAALRDATRELITLQIELGDQGQAFELLRQLTDFCETMSSALVPKSPDAARIWRRELAQAHLTWGTNLLRTGEAESQLEHFETARAVFQSLFDEGMTGLPIVTGLAEAQAGAGPALSNLGRSNEARARFAEAIQWQQVAVRLAPDDVSLRRTLSRLRMNYSVVLNRMGKPELARRQVEAAQALDRELGDDSASNPAATFRLAAAHLNEGVEHQRQGRHAAALEAYRLAEGEWRRLTAKFPSENEFQNGLGQTLWSKVYLLRQLNRHTDALPIWQELVSREQANVAKSPGVTEFRGRLLESRHNLGHSLSFNNRAEEAHDSFREALTLADELRAEFPTDARWQQQAIDLCLHEVNYARDRDEFPRARTLLADRWPSTEPFARRSDLTPQDQLLIRNYLTQWAEVLEVCGDLVAAADTWGRVRAEDARTPGFQQIDARLRQVAAGEATAPAEEQTRLAKRAADRGEFALAHRLYAEALQAQPSLAEDRTSGLRFQAASAALRAAAAEQDAVAANAGRRQALGWLQAEWQAWRADAQANSAAVGAALHPWRQSPAFHHIRNAPNRTDLEPGERGEWAALWNDLAPFLKR